METLKDHFIYEYNPELLYDMFYSLSDQMKELHERKQFIPGLNMGKIVVDKSIHFSQAQPAFMREEAKRQNITAFAKIMIGCYLSQGVKFQDLSVIEDSWFLENLDDIFQCVQYPGFEKEYFRRVFSGENIYYSDYMDKINQEEQISNAKSEGRIRSLVKSNGHNMLPEETQKAARIHVAFNPLLVGLSIAVIAVMTIMFILIN